MECIVIWFNSKIYSRKILEVISDKQKYELALNDSDNTIIWDDVKTFENAFNNKMFDFNNGFIYFI